MIIDRPMSAEWPAILDGFGFLVSLAARALGYPLVLASVLLFRRQGPGLRRGRTIFAGLGRFLSAAQRGRYIFPQLVSFFTGFPIPLAVD